VRLIYIEVSPQVVAALNGKMHFMLGEPEPMIVQMLESPNAIYSPQTHGPVELHLLMLANEKYAKIIQEAVARHEVVRLQYSKAGDNSSMELVYNMLVGRLKTAKDNLAILQEATRVATSATAACN